MVWKAMPWGWYLHAFNMFVGCVGCVGGCGLEGYAPGLVPACMQGGWVSGCGCGCMWMGGEGTATYGLEDNALGLVPACMQGGWAGGGVAV